MSLSGVYGQEHLLQIKTNSLEDKSVIDSLQKTLKIDSKEAVQTELNAYLKRIELKGFLNSRLDSLVEKDTLSIAYILPGPQLQTLHIRYGHLPFIKEYLEEYNHFNSKTDGSVLTLPFSELTDLMNSLVSFIEEQGQAFSELSLVDIEIHQEQAWANLHLEQKTERHIDKVIIKGFENFPKKFIDRDLGLQTGTVYNKENLNKASKAVNLLPFAEESKPPEVLFTKDSTIVYLYLGKKKSNRFDGILGFASKEDGSGIEFNGYLDLSINNLFNGGETIALFWKSNGQNRQRFYLETEVPFLFSLPLTPKVNFELYRQDSTFNNLSLQVSLRYQFKNTSQLAANFNTGSSNDLTNGSTTGINSYNNRFYGLSYSLKMPTSDPVFPIALEMNAAALLGNRQSDTKTVNQQQLLLQASYLYRMHQKHFVFIQNNSGVLNSEDYLENELFRIGGINNLRGVNEESIFASAYTIFNLEYRYKPNTSSYFYSITDYAYAVNERVQSQSGIYSLGLGYAFQTKAGLLNLSYAIGKFEDTPFSFDNSKIHVKMVSNF